MVIAKMTSSKRLKLVVLTLGLVGGSAFLTPLSSLPAIGSSNIELQSPKSAFPPCRSKHQVHFRRGSNANPSSSTSIHATTASENSVKSTATATLSLIFMDVKLRSLFTKYSIAFPSSLAGCGALFVSMIALDSLSGDAKWGQAIYEKLNPGAIVLAKWLPVFFVPGLITLPLASGLGTAYEVS